jgi:XTP/dITP diphosphohydrolase
MSTDVVLASGNRHKLAELASVLREVAPQLRVVGQGEHGELPSIAETGSTFTENAELKARGVAAWLRERGVAGDTFVLADDSGISVSALGGKPGVMSARYAGEPTDDEANNEKLCDELGARGLERSAAHYTCVLALVRVDGGPIDGTDDCIRFDGRWNVEMRIEPRGTGGFGYDPHAWIEGGTRTVAELSDADKARISHRGRALRLLAQWLATRA